MIVLYGIPSCSTVKKARQCLARHQIAYEFHDVRLAGLSLDLLERWVTRLDDWRYLVNKKSTTWRALAPAQQALASNVEGALSLLVEQPTLLKRPVLDDGVHLLVGFEENLYEHYLL
ncbi:MAG TPA: arsenate reductase [Methylococcaceae bacterium]|nr:arsenate reductase [Methylococcaceae bacterium]